MYRIVLLLAIFITGCNGNISYVGTSEIPKNKEKLVLEIELYEGFLKEAESEIENAEESLKFAREYLKENPDGAFTNTGSNMVRRAEFELYHQKNRRSVYLSHIKSCKAKLDEYNSSSE